MDHANNIGAGNFQIRHLGAASNPPIKENVWGTSVAKAIQTQ